MSTQIGSVTLDNDVPFIDEYSFAGVNASVEPTLGGGVIVQEFERLEVGRPITLESTESMGWQRKSTVDALKALADSGVNNTYTLTIVSGQTFTKTVRFRHEVDGGPVQADPLQARPGYHEASVYYKVRIYLMVAE